MLTPWKAFHFPLPPSCPTHSEKGLPVSLDGVILFHPWQCASHCLTKVHGFVADSMPWNTYSVFCYWITVPGSMSLMWSTFWRQWKQTVFKVPLCRQELQQLLVFNKKPKKLVSLCSSLANDVVQRLGLKNCVLSFIFFLLEYFSNDANAGLLKT